MTGTWTALETARPSLAAHGVRLLYQGAELASGFLATVAPDGGPRVHPIFPVLADGELWMFIVNLSPKYRDLVRNGRFALHTMPTPEGGEEFYVRGTAVEVTDDATRRRVVEATAGRQGGAEFEALFRCRIESVLYTQWDGWGGDSPWPAYEKWTA